MTGKIREPKNNEKYPALLLVEAVNEHGPRERPSQRPQFDKLTPLFPNERFRLENGPLAIAERIVDMVAPIGKGQRGMIVAPPKAGKTTILKQIANGIIQFEPRDARDRAARRRATRGGHRLAAHGAGRRGRVLDVRQADRPTHPGHRARPRAREAPGRDGAGRRDHPRLADPPDPRVQPRRCRPRGKILTGGIDSAALYPPRRFFGAARNIEEGGSVTIIASALVETGSRMDEGIFEEFKGTGNMELRLDRQLAEKRLFPAINVDASGTRKEELLLPPEELALVIRLRRVLHALDSGAALELLIDKLRATKSNEQFLKDIAKAPAGAETRRRGPGNRRALKQVACDATKENDHEARNPPRLPDRERPLLLRQHVQDPLDGERDPRRLCSNCHPFYTGKQKLVDTGGRVERFQRRYAKTQAGPTGREAG